MNILLLSLGGGGGNILRSVKALYRRDLAVAEQSDPAYAGRWHGDGDDGAGRTPRTAAEETGDSDLRPSTCRFPN